MQIHNTYLDSGAGVADALQSCRDRDDLLDGLACIVKERYNSGLGIERRRKHTRSTPGPNFGTACMRAKHNIQNKTNNTTNTNNTNTAPLTESVLVVVPVDQRPEVIAVQTAVFEPLAQKVLADRRLAAEDRHRDRAFCDRRACVCRVWCGLVVGVQIKV